VLGSVALALACVVLLPVGCGSSGGATSGQTCYMATDCAQGLYCYGVTLTTPGKCTSNASMAQPPSDGAIPDGGIAPELDAPATSDTAVPQKDSASVDVSVDSKPTKDSAAPPDMGPPPMDSGGAG
jgi:hypothetical protein